MKLPALVLAVSVAANVVLGLWFLKAPPPGTDSRDQSPARGSAAHSGQAATGASPKNDAVWPNLDGRHNLPTLGQPLATASSPTEDAVWPVLIGTGDLSALVERLRAGGFPPDVIRGIVGAQIAEQFNERRQALAGTPEVAPFWQTGMGPPGSQIVMIGSTTFITTNNSGQTAETQTALRALGREQSQLMEQLLGTDYLALDELQRASLQNTYGNLPVEKIVELQRLTRDYSELRSQLITEATPNAAGQQEKFALLEQELRADLTTLLSPDELEQHDMRSSPTASMLRSRLAAFNPTEEEFRALFRVQRNLEQKQGVPPYGSMGQLSGALETLGTGPFLTSMQGVTQPEVLSELQRVLSPERFEEFKLANDPAYRNISRITGRFGLPMSAAQEVVAVQKDIQQRLAAVRTNRSLSPEQRNVELEALSQEANGRITDAIGVRGLEAYREYGGTWLNSLRPTNPTNR